MAPITYPEKSILIPLIKVYELLVETIQHFQHVKFLELKKRNKDIIIGYIFNEKNETNFNSKNITCLRYDKQN